MLKDKILKSVIKEVAEESGLTPKQVEDIYDSQWNFISKTVSDLDFEDVDEEEFNELKTNFNVPEIGKFYTYYNKVNNVRIKSRDAKERGGSPENDV